MNFPIQLAFKLVAISSRIYARDSTGADVCFVKQKRLKLREHVEVFKDDSRKELVANIKASKILDFSSAYAFSMADGTEFGAVRRKGMRSLWKAHYEILDSDKTHVMNINEENGWVKVLDGFLGEIPLVGFLSGYFLNPSYLVTRIDGTPVIRLKKVPAFWEGKFSVEKIGDLSESEELRAFMSILMMVILERSRG